MAAMPGQRVSLSLRRSGVPSLRRSPSTFGQAMPISGSLYSRPPSSLAW